MDKRVIFAVAGSGKTTYIINQLDSDTKAIVITYTINNTKNLRQGIINKFGCIPPNIKLYSYFTFLYSFCFKPFLLDKLKPKGILWESPPQWTNKVKRDKFIFYATKSRYLYHNRIARLLEETEVLEKINHRIAKYYDFLFIDEIQDFAGHDFNLLKSIAKSDINQLFVGDFFQHTFDTSRDGNVNSSIHKDYQNFAKEFEKSGVKVDTITLDKSFRCSSNICDFISSKLGISIESKKKYNTNVIEVNSEADAEKIIQDDHIVKLFLKEHYKFDCFSKNWGDCKGENHYNDVCVVLNKRTSDLFKKGKLIELAPTSKNKLYVACTRANGNLYLIDYSYLDNYKVSNGYNKRSYAMRGDVVK